MTRDSQFKSLMTLHAGSRSTVLLVENQKQQRFVAKLPSSANDDAMGLERLEREHSLLQQVANPKVIASQGLSHFNGRPALILENIDGRSIRHYIEQKELDIPSVLNIGLEVSLALENLHQKGVIHKDINPSNIIWNQDKDVIKVIDLDIATRLPYSQMVFTAPGHLEGTLDYLAPEQTGRVNRGIDRRADFYNFGATLYEMVAGHPPFPVTDMLALLYAHVAQKPDDVRDFNKKCPAVLARLIAKLLEKNPADRYQSAYGLIRDLKTIKQEFSAKKKRLHFVLGRYDRIETFTPPERLYGRQLELQTLQKAFSHAAQGGKSLVMIGGEPGIGKSALVRECHPLITQFKGSFAQGKFEQFRAHLPYHAMVDAMNQLLQQRLGESSKMLNMWQNRVLKAVGPNAGLLIELIPMLAHMIGKHEPPPELPPEEAKNRLRITFQRFIRSLVTREHPIALFLDDLQWADLPSVQLLESLLGDPMTKFLAIFTTYRDNEVSAEHPMFDMIRTAEEANVRVEEEHLCPLTFQHVNTLIGDCFGMSLEQARTLGKICMARTMGNPFFLSQYLKKLHEDGILAFNSEKGRWVCDLERATATHATNNVVVLMTERINALPFMARKVLVWGACLGNQFEYRLLARVWPDAFETLHDAIIRAAEIGFLIPGNESYRNAPKPERLPDLSLRFLHDKMQQAFYQLESVEVRKGHHLTISRELLKKAPQNPKPDHLFQLLSHAAHALDLIKEEAERVLFAKLHLQGGNAAKRAAAWEPAYRFFERGLSLLTAGQCEGNQRELAFELTMEQAECGYLMSNYEKAFSLLSALEPQNHDPMTAARIRLLRVKAHTNLGELAEAVEHMMAGAELLGLKLPREPEAIEAAVKQEIGLIESRLCGREMAAMKDLPQMEDPSKQLLIHLMLLCGPAAYQVNSALFLLINTKIVSLSQEFGNANGSAYGWSIYGLILGALLGDHHRGFQTGQMAIALNEEFDNGPLRATLHHLYAQFLSHWVRPLADSIDHLDLAFRYGLESGELVHVGYACSRMVFHSFAQGTPLSLIISKTNPRIEFLTSSKDVTNLDQSRPWLQLIRALQGKTTGLGSFDCPKYDAQAEREALVERGNPLSINNLLVSEMVNHYYAGSYEIAAKIGDQVWPQRASLVGHVLVWQHIFYYGLAIMGTLRRGDVSTKEQYRDRAEELLAMLKTWSDKCPAVFEDKYTLLKAELDALDHKHEQAVSGYKQAIKSARRYGFVQNQALANELAAGYWLTREMEEFTRLYIERARECYRRWGAIAKVEQIEHEYCELFELDAVTGEPITTRNQSSSSYKNSISGDSGKRKISHSQETDVDLITILKSSQALAGGLMMDDLLRRLLRVTMEHSGADRVMILLEETGKWVIQAEAEEGVFTPKVLLGLPLSKAERETPPHIPAELIRLVIRTGKSVIIEDTMEDPAFSRSSYYHAVGPRAVLCRPIFSQGRTTGVLYLENRSAPHVFTENRMNVLDFLSGQMATSLDNARLYQDSARLNEELANLNAELEQRVKKRTKQLERARLKAEEATSAKSQFLATMSHEIRTPMNGVIGIADLISATNLNPEQREYVRIMQNSGRSLLRVINDILDFSKIEAESIQLEHINFNLEEVLEEVSALLADTAHGKGLRLETSLGPGTPRHLVGDPTRLRQILLNFAGNAIKFTEKGEVFIQGEKQHSLEKAVLLRFTVTDTGIGISKEGMKKLFSSFSQADNSTTRKYGGTGLGLAISKSLVNLMGGRVGVSSEAGEGSNFWFTVYMEEARDVETNQLITDHFKRLKGSIYGAAATRLKAVINRLCHWGIDCQGTTDPSQTALFEKELDFAVLAFESRPRTEQEEKLLAMVRKRGLPLLLLAPPGVPLEPLSEYEIRSQLPLRTNRLSNAILRITRYTETINEEQEPHQDLTVIGNPHAKILLVEDNKVNQKVATKMLVKLGFDPFIAENGIEAIAGFEEHQPDLILMDCQMPVMDGFETTSHIRGKGPSGISVPIIALTANAMKEDKERCIKAGMNDHLPKPIRLSNLRMVLAKWLPAREQF